MTYTYKVCMCLYSDSSLHVNHHPASSTPATLTNDFDMLLSSIIGLLEKFIDNLEVCKQDCCNLTISDNSELLLFGSKKLTEIKCCSSFQQLVNVLQEHFSWKEFSLLKRIISKSGSVEAIVKLTQFEQSMCSACDMNVVSDSLLLSDLPRDYVKLHVKGDNPFQDLTLESFQKFRDFIFQYLDIKLYVALPYITFDVDSQYLEWYVPVQAVPHITEAAKNDGEMLAEHSISFIQVSDKVIYDSQGKMSVEKPHGVCWEACGLLYA